MIKIPAPLGAGIFLFLLYISSFSLDSDNTYGKYDLYNTAFAQANRYTASKVVRRHIGTTTLHKIVVVYRGTEIVVCEKIV
ncbi:MAG: hypothetical protein E7096_04970 [Bacteroides sp.]|nr:hypothetical protein [Bacteroides sp.]